VYIYTHKKLKRKILGILFSYQHEEEKLYKSPSWTCFFIST
jgi:hypothetical protein